MEREFHKFGGKTLRGEWNLKVTCPTCGEAFSLNTHTFEEGDLLECGQCGAPLTVINRNNRVAVVEADEAFAEEGESFFEENGESY